MEGALRLIVTSTVEVAGGREVTRHVYTKQEAWKPKAQWNPMVAWQYLVGLK